MSSKGSAYVELETSEVEKLRIEVHQITGESQAFLFYAMRSMLIEVKRDNGRSESGSAEGSATVGEIPEGAGPTAAGQSPAGTGPTAVRETVFVTEVCGISKRRDTEKLLLLSRLVQRGISQTSQGRLARWVYTLAAVARNLASHESTGRDEIIKAVRERYHRLSANRKKGSNSGHALYAGDGAGGGHGKGGGHGNGKGGRRGKHGRDDQGTNEVGGGAAAAAGGDSSGAKATEGSAPVRGCFRCGKEGHIRANYAEKLCSRCNGRGHTAGVCPTSEEEAVLPMTGEVGARVDVSEDGTAQA